MDKIKLPKLHLACASDELRPVMQHILLTKNDIVASDAHILSVLKTKDIFGDEFAESISDRFLIHKDQWKSFFNGSYNITFENNFIVVHYNDYKTSHKIRIEGDGFKYPNYEAIFPKEIDSEQLDQIGINPTLLKRLSDAMLMPNDYTKSLKIKFYGEHKGFLVEPMDRDNNAKGIIMPVAIN